MELDPSATWSKCYYRITDGTDYSGFVELSGQNSDMDDFKEQTITGLFSYGSEQSDITFYLQAYANNGNVDACVVWNNYSGSNAYNMTIYAINLAGGSGGGGGSSLWTDSGSNYIEYSSALGGMRVASLTGNPAPTFSSAGANVLSDLGDVNTSGVSAGEILLFSGGQWVPGTSSGGGFWIAGTGTDIYYDDTEADVGIGMAPPVWHDSNGLNDLAIDGEIFMTGDLKTASAVEVGNDEGFTWDDWSTGIWGSSATDSIRFETDGSEQMQLTSAGNFGIGDTNPSVALDVVGDINFTGQIVDVSDIRMKYDIQPLDSPLRKLSSLNGFAFKMKDDPKKTVEYGVSAQDVLEVFPELVHEVDSNGTLGVNYNGLIAPMIEAMKEQQTEIEALRSQNDMLLRRLERLERQQNIIEQ